VKNYRLKLTALTPIHIGTGEVYEPTNFIIDDGWLYEFDEVLFFKHLPQQKKLEFTKLSALESDTGYELFEKIHAFVLENKEYAKDVSVNRVKVSKAIEQHYNKSIAKKVQVEGRGRNSNSVFNRFEIQKTQRLVNNVSTFLTGSSIKGAISTAFQEFIYKKNGKDEMDRLFDKDKLFKNLSISDSIAQKANSEIGYAVNQERFETEDDAQISTFIEVNSKDSEYLVNLSIKNFHNDDNQKVKEKITKEKIIEACNNHYKLIYNSKESAIKLKENQFLLSIGKHSGARAVTIDGLRKVLVKLAQISNKRDEGNDSEKRVERLHKKSYFENEMIKRLFSDFELLDDKEKRDFKNAKQFIDSPSDLEWLVEQRKSLTINAILIEETTVWKFSETKNANHANSFGWVLCEFIDEKSFDSTLKSFNEYGVNLIEKYSKRQKEIIEKIAFQKEERIKLALAREERLKQEAEEKAKKEAQEKDKLASMSPLEQKIEKLAKKEPNVPKITLFLKAIKNGNFDKEKCDALNILKKLMKENKKWKEKSTKKNPKKDKEYKNTLDVIDMIKTCI